MLNRVILIGRLTKDPELRYTPTGIAVTQFTLAVDRPFTSQGGEKETDFLPIVTWRQLAETCANYLRRGRLTAIEGRVQVRNYENNEGRRVYVTEIVADNVRFLESSNRDSRNNETLSSNRNSQAGRNTDPFSDDGKPIDISDDDLPF
ncbi:single-stranded DNA-binding protein [Paenibacillus terrae]|uniref:Single-stranded DNA-binding protein n=1 Tax=Paenibacillus terrae TaxID=159743 RepID=A0A0D7WUT4_9BACL|nr:single-stranded DNA-binding protein [Paenibacillus terrae]KJD42946.1 single-stranded DNA-binding protein [Paenibacillus terrae]